MAKGAAQWHAGDGASASLRAAPDAHRWVALWQHAQWVCSTKCVLQTRMSEYGFTDASQGNIQRGLGQDDTCGS